MADAPRKTYPDLAVQADVQDTDLLASWRGTGPLKGLPASDLVTYIDAGIQPTVHIAVAAAATATTAAAVAVSNAGAAEVSAAEAQQAADEAMLARITSGYYPGSGPRSDVPRGITGYTALVAGSGGTNGTFALGFSGGNLSVPATGTFTVSGGALTSITITGPGLYVGASPSTPAAVFTASAGLTGASATLTEDFLIGSGGYYLTDDATDTTLADVYQNVSGVATATSPLSTFKKTLLNAVVPCTVGGTANAISMTPITGFSVTSSGANQEFMGFAAATNSTAGLTISIAGVNGGAATQVLMPEATNVSGIAVTVPARALRTSYPFKVKWDATLTKFILVTPSFTPQQSAINLILVPGESTANSLVAKLAFPLVRTPGDLANVSFSLNVILDATSGSKSLKLYDFDGTTVIITNTTIQLPGAVSASAAGVWKAYNTVTLQRQGSGLFWLEQAPNTAIDSVTPFAFAIDPWGMPVTDEKAVSVRQAGPNTYLVKVSSSGDDYFPITGRADYQAHNEVFAATIFDMRNFQANVPNGAICLNSFFSHFLLTDSQHCNLQFTELQVTNTTDTGQVPSTFEPPMFVGNYADAVGSYVPRGIGHGYMTGTACSMKVTEGGVDGPNIYNSGITTAATGDKLTTVLTGFITDTPGNILAGITYTETYEPAATYQAKYQCVYDYSVAERAVTAGTVIGGYAFILPMQGVNRCAAYLNGAKVISSGGTNGVQTIDLRDGSITTIGICDTVIFWHTLTPNIQTVCTNLTGLGKSCLIDGVAQTAAYASFIHNNSWGPKLLGSPVYDPSGAKRDISGKVFTFNQGIKVQVGDPIT